jgi:hypothetical protein
MPVVPALAAGAYPGWRAVTRPTAVDLSMRQIMGNGIDLIWAPAGPGWDDSGFSWFEVKRRCNHSTADGKALAAALQPEWRLPTVGSCPDNALGAARTPAECGIRRRVGRVTARCLTRRRRSGIRTAKSSIGGRPTKWTSIARTASRTTARSMRCARTGVLPIWRVGA